MISLSQFRNFVPIQKPCPKIRNLVPNWIIIPIQEPCLNSGTLSQFRNLVPIQEPCPNSGTMFQFRNLVQNGIIVPIQEPCPNLGNLFKIQNSTTKPSLPFKKRLQFIPFPSYLPFHHPPSSPLISYINKYFFLINKKFY